MVSANEMRAPLLVFAKTTAEVKNMDKKKKIKNKKIFIWLSGLV